MMDTSKQPESQNSADGIRSFTPATRVQIPQGTPVVSPPPESPRTTCGTDSTGGTDRLEEIRSCGLYDFGRGVWPEEHVGWLIGEVERLRLDVAIRDAMLERAEAILGEWTRIAERLQVDWLAERLARQEASRG